MSRALFECDGVYHAPGAFCHFQLNKHFLKWAVKTFRIPISIDEIEMDAYYSRAWHPSTRYQHFVGNSEAVSMYRLYDSTTPHTSFLVYVICSL
jgi:hypothetical protein